ncbi:MAG: hypothetical protein ABIJ42_10300 [Acidobacteriota bacterium]
MFEEGNFDNKTYIRVADYSNAAKGSYSARQKCLEAGMNDYLSKPVDPIALAGILENWLPEEKEKAAPSK